MVTVSGNSNPTNPTYPTNPTNSTNPNTINSGELTDKNCKIIRNVAPIFDSSRFDILSSVLKSRTLELAN